MKKWLIICFVFTGAVILWAQSQKTDEIQLIVRGDDMGMAHAVNQACIDAFQNGILTTVELMAPCPWFPEAVKILKENQNLDVGLHLVLTSEWENMKWRPMTHAVTLMNKDSYFYPTVWDMPGFPPNSNLMKSDWKLSDVERELRAQIELALKKAPWISHLSDHMAFTRTDPQLKTLVERLADEYRLHIDLPASGVKFIGGFGGSNKSAEEKEAALEKILGNLQPGLWIIIDHPAYDTPEMRALGHVGYENVAADRAGVFKAFTSKRIKEIIKRRHIKLINYKDVKRINN